VTDTHKAKLAFMSQPTPGVYLFNLQFDNGENMRISLSRAQLGNAVVDGAVMLWGSEIAANVDIETNAAFVTSLP
jgi:hypothetical protein